MTIDLDLETDALAEVHKAYLSAVRKLLPDGPFLVGPPREYTIEDDAFKFVIPASPTKYNRTVLTAVAPWILPINLDSPKVEVNLTILGAVRQYPDKPNHKLRNYSLYKITYDVAGEELRFPRALPSQGSLMQIENEKPVLIWTALCCLSLKARELFI